MAGDAGAPGRAGDRALLLSPSRFAGRLGARRVGRAPLSAIVLLEVAPDGSGWQLVRLGPDAAVAALDACRYGAPAVRDAPTLFGGLARTAALRLPPVAVRIARLVSTVPVFACRIGRDAYDMPIGPLLDALDAGTVR
jgi:hypothetical protein